MTPENRVDRSGLVVDRRARHRTRARHGLEEAAGEVRQALGDDLPVVVDLLPALIGNGFGDRQRLEQADERDGQSAWGQLAHFAELHGRDVRERQTLRDFRGQGHRGVTGVIFGRPSGEVSDQGREDQYCQQVQLRQPEAFHQAPQDDGQHHCRGADDQRAVVERIAVEQREIGTFQHRLPPVALVLHPQRVAELTHRDQNGRRQQKAEDD